MTLEQRARLRDSGTGGYQQSHSAMLPTTHPTKPTIQTSMFGLVHRASSWSSVNQAEREVNNNHSSSRQVSLSWLHWLRYCLFPFSNKCRGQDAPLEGEAEDQQDLCLFSTLGATAALPLPHILAQSYLQQLAFCL